MERTSSGARWISMLLVKRGGRATRFESSGLARMRVGAIRAVSGLLVVAFLSACATQGTVQPGTGIGLPASSETPPTTVTEADRKSCEELARAEAADAADVRGGSVAGDIAVGLLVGLLGVLTYQPLAPIGAGKYVYDNAKVRQAAYEHAYDHAMQACLEPAHLAETLGPDHPEVASSLHRVAERFVAKEKYGHAEPLCQLALAIQGQALGPEHPDVAPTLDAYAIVLRKLNREAEAEEMTTRAQKIRWNAEGVSDQGL